MRLERSWSWPSVPQEVSRAHGVVILGSPPQMVRDTLGPDDELLGQLLLLDPGLVGFFLVSAHDLHPEGTTSLRAGARRAGWSVAVMDPEGEYSSSSSPGLFVWPTGKEPHFIELGALPPSVDPLEVALQVMRPDLVVAGYHGRAWPAMENVNLVSIRKGIALASLHLRRRGVFLLDASQGSTLRTDKGSFYRIGAKALVPSLRLCGDVCRVAWLANSDDTSPRESERLERISSLLTTVEQRVLRALQARDRFRWGTDFVSGNDDDVHLDLDSFLLALQGALDAGVRAINLASALKPPRRRSPNWRISDWVDALSDRWPQVASVYTESETMRAAVDLLADFRNRIHSDTWGYVRNGRWDQAHHEREIWIRCDDPKVPDFLTAMEQLGGPERWRWNYIGPTSIFLDPVSLVEELLCVIPAFLDLAFRQMAVEWKKDLYSQTDLSKVELSESETSANPWWKERESGTVLSQLGVREPHEH